MSEQQKKETYAIALLLQDLSKEDWLKLQGVIAGMKLARSTEKRAV